MAKFNSELVDIELYVWHCTPDAIKVSDDDEDDKSAVWLPLNAVEIDDSPVDVGSVIGEVKFITIPRKLAEEKGLL